VPEDIVSALKKIAFTQDEGREEFSMKDMEDAVLSGGPRAKERREALGAVLGIGYGNSSSFLKKLNRFGITRQQFEKGLKDIDKGKTV